jgi:peptidoglycan hydrolase CwlO-like protein
VKRKLNNDELVIATKSLTNRKEELSWLQYQLKYYDLMLAEGIEINYKKTLREYKTQKADIESQIKQLQVTIDTLSKQIREGVDMIEEKDSKTKGQKGGEK